MKIGYARVSTEDQNLALQRDALNAAGCERVFEDKESGAKADRPGLAEARAFARPGDVLVVWRLDRLGRSLPDLVQLVGELEKAGIGFESLTEKIETGSAAGRLVFHVFAALAEFERNITRERTLAGLAAARARGRSGGRPGITPEKKAALEALASDPEKRPGEICKALGISRATFYKYAPCRGDSARVAIRQRSQEAQQ
jgi:DNA invertase Pin-like site-specific DNA recombinase